MTPPVTTITSAAPPPESRFKRLMKEEKSLLIAIVLLVIFFHIPWLRFILYPFGIFSTWVHELCHGIAALCMGGRIDYIELYANYGGVCYYEGLTASTDTSMNLKHAFIVGAGFTGTALGGCLMLICRRRFPKMATRILGFTICVSCILFVRNAFGLLVMIPFGIVLILCSWFLPVKKGLGVLFSFLGATCCVNAMWDNHDNIHDAMFDDNESDNAFDAMKMTEYLGGTYLFWTALWMLQSVVYLMVGLLFPFPAKDQRDVDTGDASVHSNGNIDEEALYVDAEVVAIPVATAYVTMMEPSEDAVQKKKGFFSKK